MIEGAGTGAVTVKELVETISWPWFRFLGSGVQFGPNAAPPLSYWLPYQEALKVYVPAAAGAVPVNWMGIEAPPPIVFGPVLLFTSTPVSL